MTHESFFSCQCVLLLPIHWLNKKARMLQCVSVSCSVAGCMPKWRLCCSRLNTKCVVCCNVWQCVAVCFRELQRVASLLAACTNDVCVVVGWIPNAQLIMSRVQSYVWHDSFTCEWLICMWMHHVLFSKSHMNEAYISIISAHISIRSAHSSIRSALLMSRVQRYVWHDSFTCKWLVYMWMNHVSFVM